MSETISQPIGLAQSRYTVGASAQQDFPVGFRFDNPSDLRVTVAGADEPLFSLIETTQVDGIYTAATLRLPAAVASVEVVITRQTRLEQQVVFPPNGPLSTRQLNREVARLWQAEQDDARRFEATLRSDVSEPVLPALPAAAARANRFLAFDASGRPVASPGSPPANVPVSAYATGLLSAGSAAATRAVLGLIEARLWANLITNGDFIVSQRRDVTLTADGWVADRWRFRAGPGDDATGLRIGLNDVTRQQIGREGVERMFRVDITAGGTGLSDGVRLTQRIENVGTLSNSPCVLRFWARVIEGSGAFAVEFAQVFGTGGSATVFLPPTRVQLRTDVGFLWQEIVVPVSMPSIVGKTLGAPTCTELNFWFSAPTALNARTTALGPRAQWIEIADVSLERSTEPTGRFVPRPVSVETVLCQRFYQEVPVTLLCNLTPNNVFGGAIVQLPLPTQMRATPTARLVSLSPSRFAPSAVVGGLSVWRRPWTTAVVDDRFALSPSTDSIGIWNGGAFVESGDYAGGGVQLEAELG